MKWDEFKALISGLSAETPLGRIASIRLEDDADTLKNFSKSQLAIRSNWRNERAKTMDEKALQEVVQDFKNMFLNMDKGR